MFPSEFPSDIVVFPNVFPFFVFHNVFSEFVFFPNVSRSDFVVFVGCLNVFLWFCILMVSCDFTAYGFL